MANFSYTLLELVQKVSFAAGNFKVKIETLTNPDPPTQHMIECVNEVIRSIWNIKPTPWNQGESYIAIQETYDITTTSSTSGVGGLDYSDSTITVTNGSSSATITSTGDDIGTDYAAWVNRALWFTGTDAGYGFMRINAAVDGGSDDIDLTFDEAWPYATLTNKTTWRASLDRYELASDFGDFITAIAVPEDAVGSSSSTPSRTLKIGNVQELETLRHTMRSSPTTIGNPNFITVAKKSSNNLWLAELDPFPEDVGIVKYRYSKVPAKISADADAVPLPDEHYDLLSRGVIALWQQRTGMEGREQAFEIWKKTDLAEYATLGRRTTDGMPRIIPSDSMRASSSPLI